MGAAVSSNVAQAVTNVNNNIQQTTSANSNQEGIIKNHQSLNRCVIEGNLNIDNTSNTVQTNRQVETATQNTDVSNKIAQNLMQQAQSTVGSLGIGYANASNSASILANSSTNIANTINAISRQFSYTDNSFQCEDSYIGGNVNLSNLNDNTFSNEQVLKNDQVAQVVNDVSQTISQTASATVQGLTGALLAIALIIAAFGYTISKPLDSKAGKVLIIVIIILLIAGIVIWLYIAMAPPFFNEPVVCCPLTNLGCQKELCQNLQKSSVDISSPLMKYMFKLKNDTSSSGIDLVNIVLNSQVNPSGVDRLPNQGYNEDKMNKLGDSDDGVEYLGADDTYNEDYWCHYNDTSDDVKTLQMDFNSTTTTPCPPGPCSTNTDTKPSVARLPNLLTLNPTSHKPISEQTGWKIPSQFDAQGYCTPNFMTQTQNFGDGTEPKFCYVGNLQNQNSQTDCLDNSTKNCGKAEQHGGDWKTAPSATTSGPSATPPSSVLAFVNSKVWDDYLSGERMTGYAPVNNNSTQAWEGEDGEKALFKEDKDAIARARQKHARFILCKMLQGSSIQLDNFYFTDYEGNEEISYFDKTDASKIKSNLAKCDNFENSLYYSVNKPNIWMDGIGITGTGKFPGTVMGNFGVCNTNLNKFQNSAKVWFPWVFAVFALGVFLFIIFHSKKKNAEKSDPKSD